MMIPREDLGQIDPGKLKKVHFVGLLSPFSSYSVRTLLDMGVKVTASEYVQGDFRRKQWEDDGILYPGPHDSKYITKDMDLVVFPNGPIPGNPECERTEELGLPAVTVGQMVGILSREFKTIAVAGTHGKTTTTALITWMIYKIAGAPNYLVGDAEDYILGLKKNWNSTRDSDYFVAECCEYKQQFLDRSPQPYISVITNIDLDHTDCYPDQNSYNEAFVEFISHSRYGIVLDSAAVNEKAILNEVRENNPSVKVFDIADYREHLGRIESSLFGLHNQENLLRAYGAGVALGFNESEVLEALKSFPGISRRFEFAGVTVAGAKIFKDYAHNPQKVRACIQGAKEAFSDKSLLFVFQPHSFERSYTFRNEFAESISQADEVIVSNIFSPRRESDEERSLISEKDFVEILRDKNPEILVHFAGDLSSTVKLVNELDKGPEWIIVLASAGDLHNIVDKIRK